MFPKEKILYWSVVIILAAILTTPLIFSGRLFFPYTSAKTFYFRILLEIAFIFYLPLILFYKKYRPRLNSVFWVATLLLGCGIVSAYFGKSFHASFWSDYERMMGLLTYAHLWLYFLILISIMRDEKDWARYFNISILVSLGASLYGVWQKMTLTNIGRVESTMGNAAFLASFLLIQFFIALYLLGREKKFGLKSAFYASAAFFDGLVIFLTATRGAILGIAIGLTTLALFFVFSRHDFSYWVFSRRKMKIIGAAFIVLVAVSLLSVWFFRDSLAKANFSPVQRIASISLSDRTTEGRLLSWRVALNGIKERPIFGWGPENFIILFNKYYDPALFAQEPWFDRAHNIFLDLTSSLGIAGLLLFSVLLWIIFRNVWARNNSWSYTDKAIMTSFGFAYLINDTFVFDNATVLIFIVMVLAYVSRTNNEVAQHIINNSLSNAGFKPEFLKVMIVILGTLATLVLILKGNAAQLGKNAKSYEALSNIYANSDDASAIDAYEKTMLEPAYMDAELTRFFAELVFNLKRGGSKLAPAMEKKYFNTALRLISRNVSYEQENARWLVYLENLYILGDKLNPEYAATAEIAARRALFLSPKRQQIYFDLSQALIDQNKMDEAFKVLESAISLDPRFPLAHRHLATFAILSGRDDIASREIDWLSKNSWPRENIPAEAGWHTSDNDIEDIVEAYTKVKKYNKASNFYKILIDRAEAEYSQNKGFDVSAITNVYTKFAALQAMSGDKDGAYRAALRVFELDPSRRIEAENFLQTIGRALPK